MRARRNGVLFLLVSMQRRLVLRWPVDAHAKTRVTPLVTWNVLFFRPVYTVPREKCETLS